MGDRRFETRHPASEPVEVCWPAAAENRPADQQQTGTLRDVSRSGARFYLDVPVPINSSVLATIRGEQVVASVRFCIRKAPGFLIGIEFEPEYQGKVKTR